MRSPVTARKTRTPLKSTPLQRSPLRAPAQAALATVAAIAALAALGVAGSARAATDGSWVKSPLVGVWDAALERAPTSSNTTAVSNWRLDPNAAFNGVAAAFNGTARLLFQETGSSGTFVCSGSLMPGGEWVLTAAHCVDNLASMTVQFGLFNNTALQTRSVTSAVQHPGWAATGGALDTGADIALVRLDAPVTTLNSYHLSTTNDVGRDYLLTGYGSTTTGTSTAASGWGDSAYGHYGHNVTDTTSAIAFGAWDSVLQPGCNPATTCLYVAPTYGQTYVSDFDSTGIADPARYNTLQRMAAVTGNAYASGLALGGNREALIAGGDSGGGDFVWDAASGSWLLSAVHSWGWQFCPGRFGSGTAGGGSNCDYRSGNDTSFGDISGSTAMYGHVAWVESVVGRSVTLPVPEPGTWGLMALGLLAVAGAARRRR